MPKDKLGKDIVVGDLVTGMCPEEAYEVTGIVQGIDKDRLNIAIITKSSSLCHTLGRHALVICYLHWVVAKDFTKL